MFNCRIAFRHPNAFGSSPIDPTLIPLALLRAHAAAKDPKLLEEGLYELRQNLALGRPVFMVPRKMLQHAGRRLPDLGRRVDPTTSAATVCAAFQSAQHLAPSLRARYFNAPSHEAIEAARESAFRAMQPARGAPAPSISDASTSPFARPRQAAVVGSVSSVAVNAIARAQRELELQQQRVLAILSNRKPTVSVR
jgi:hypothetical protein